MTLSVHQLRVDLRQTEAALRAVSREPVGNNTVQDRRLSVEVHHLTERAKNLKQTIAQLEDADES